MKSRSSSEGIDPDLHAGVGCINLDPLARLARRGRRTRLAPGQRECRCNARWRSVAEPAVATCSPLRVHRRPRLAQGDIQLLAAAGTSRDQSVSTVGVGSSGRGHSTGAPPFLTSPPQPCSVEVRGRGFTRSRPPRKAMGRTWGLDGGRCQVGTFVRRPDVPDSTRLVETEGGERWTGCWSWLRSRRGAVIDGSGDVRTGAWARSWTRR